MIKAKIYFLNGFIDMENGLDKKRDILLRDLNIKVSDYFDSNFIELPITPVVGMGVGIHSFIGMDMFTKDELEELTEFPQFTIKYIQLNNGSVYLDVE